MPPAVATPESVTASPRFEHMLLEFLAYLELERGLSRTAPGSTRAASTRSKSLPG